MKVGYAQFYPEFGNKSKNLQKSIEMITRGKDADLLVLPELCNTGYLFETKNELNELAEKIPNGDTTQAWIEIAEKTNTYLICGIAEKTKDQKLYNSAVIIGPDGFIDVYRKLHLFAEEKFLFNQANTPPKIYDFNGMKAGVIVCFDWAFPEISRFIALKGADIICHPANLVLPFAQKAMLTRSIENRVFTITANRFGLEKRPKSSITFTGESQITSPKMEILCQSKIDNEEVRVMDIDYTLARKKMITEHNHVFDDRRLDIYSQLFD